MDYEGLISLDRQLSEEHAAYLVAFTESRHMRRDPLGIVATYPDPIREKAGLPLGVDAGYFVGGTTASEWNSPPPDWLVPPAGQPENWCSVALSADSMGLEIAKQVSTKYVMEWLVYIIDHFLEPWGYIANGQMKWWGSSMGDTGIIVVNNNKVSRMFGRVVYDIDYIWR